MWAYTLEGPRRFRRIEVPPPSAANLADGRVIVRTLAGGICGSDVPIYQGRRSTRWAPGEVPSDLSGFPLHEIVGEVAVSRHASLTKGDLVVGWASNVDGLAEFVDCHGGELYAYDRELEPHVAVLLQPLACAIFAMERLGAFQGERCAVIGLGPIGLLFTHLLKSRGAGHVVGVDRMDRAALASVFGIDESVRRNSDYWAAGLEPGSMPSTVIEAVGHQVGTLSDAILAAAPGGQIYYFGLPDDPVYPIPMMSFLRKNLTLYSGVTINHRKYLRYAAEYLSLHPQLASAYITHSFSIDDVGAAFEAALSPKSDQVKVTVTM